MVLSEPFSRIEAGTTYRKIPPRKRPALGRRYRTEQDFSSGLRRRDDRRTGTPDPSSAALYGRVLKASSHQYEVASGTKTLSDAMKPIAAPMVGGMITSTIRVLILVPVFFVLMKERALRGARCGRILEFRAV